MNGKQSKIKISGKQKWTASNTEAKTVEKSTKSMSERVIKTIGQQEAYVKR